MKNEFKDSMSIIEQDLKYRISSTDDQKLLKSLEKDEGNDLKVEKLFWKLHDKETIIEFGSIYQNGCDNIKTIEGYHLSTDSQVMYELMGKLQLQIAFSDFNSKEDISTQLLWVKLRCKACRKSCWIRKRSGVKLERFITKIIVSIWSVHVFASSVPMNSEWHQANPNWIVCKARTSGYFEKLKRASIQDSKD